MLFVNRQRKMVFTTSNRASKVGRCVDASPASPGACEQKFDKDEKPQDLCWNRKFVAELLTYPSYAVRIEGDKLIPLAVKKDFQIGGRDGGCIKAAIDKLMSGLNTAKLPTFCGADDLREFARANDCTLRVVSCGNVAFECGQGEKQLVLLCDDGLTHCRGAQIFESGKMTHDSFADKYFSLLECGTFKQVSEEVICGLACVTCETDRGTFTVSGPTLNHAYVSAYDHYCSLQGCVSKAISTLYGRYVPAPRVVKPCDLTQLAKSLHCSVAVVLQDHLVALAGDPQAELVVLKCESLSHCDSAAFATRDWIRSLPTAHAEFALASQSENTKDGAKAKKKRTRNPRYKAKTEGNIGILRPGYRKFVAGKLNSFAAQANKAEGNEEFVTALTNLAKQVQVKHGQDGFVASNYKIRPNPMHASNFSASNFAATNFSAENIEETTGFLKTCSTFPRPNEFLPKRVGGTATSLVMRVMAQQTVSLTGMGTGDAIYVFTPVASSYKGAIIACRNPTSNNFTVLDVATQDRDLEKLGTTLCVLGAHMSIALPTVIGGTSAQVANVTAEFGITRGGPMSAIPGKLAAICEGREAPISILGSTARSLTALTYNIPLLETFRPSSYDVQNIGTTKVTGDANASGSGIPNGFGNLITSFPATPAYGWRDTSTNFGWADNTYTTVWNFNASNMYLRQAWFGDFTLSWDLIARVIGTIALEGAVLSPMVAVKVTYVDGSVAETVTQCAAIMVVSAMFASSLMTDTITHSSMEGWKPATLIANIELRCACYRPAGLSTAPYIETSASYYPGGITGLGLVKASENCFVSIEWREVFNNNRYLVAVLSGAIAAARITVQLTVDTEVIVDQTSAAAAFVQPTEEPPIDEELAKHALLESGSAGQVGFTAGSFKSGLKKFFGKIGKVGKHIAEAKFGPALMQLDPTGRSNNELFAAGFTHNSNSGTGFWYPAVGKGEDGSEIVRVIEVLREDAEFVSQNEGVSGRSGTLAYLCAQLHQLGFPIVKGAYTGEVDEVDISGDRATFLLLPVAAADYKLNVPNLRGWFPSGCVLGGVTSKDLRNSFFGRLVNVEYRYVPLEEPFPPGSRGVVVEISK